MKIAGLQKFTLVDYPGKVACTVFTLGCNFRCGFCHNPELVNLEARPLLRGLASKLRSRTSKLIPEKTFFGFLKEQKGFLDAVCITGGEPTIQDDLVDFIKKIKEKGLAVKLDTNGSNPKILEEILKEKIVDYVAMDIKAPINRYKEISGENINTENIKKSVELIKKSGVDYEFRTTVIPGFHGAGDFEQIGEWLSGASKYYLQQFRPEKTLDPAYGALRAYPDEMLKEFCGVLGGYVKFCDLRLL
jgi:pyruvate formate lyase activating enzyme